MRLPDATGQGRGDRRARAAPPAPAGARLPAATERAAAWDLRAAWATRREVALTLSTGRRLRGWVEHVAASNAYALLWVGDGTVHVPLALVASSRRPHFHEDGAGPAAPPPPGRIIELAAIHPGQLALDVGEGDRPEGWGPDGRAGAARAAARARRAC